MSLRRIAPFHKKILILTLTAVLFAVLSVFIHNPKLYSGSEGFHDLGDSFEYCRSNSHLGADCTEKKSWQKVKVPGEIPHDSRNRNIWFRIKLPENWNLKYFDPAVFLSNPYPTQAYGVSRGTEDFPASLLYSYGIFRQDGTAEFPGFNRTQFIRMPAKSDFNYIYIRIYIFYMKTEIMHPLLLGDYSSLVLNEFVSEIDITVISLFYFTFSIFAVFVYLKERELKSFLYAAVLSILAGIAGIYITDFKKHIYDNPKLYTLIFAPCLYAFSPALQLYIISIFGKGWKSSFLVSFRIFIVILIFSPLVPLTGDEKYYYILELPYIVLSAVSLINILIHIVWFIRQENVNAFYFGLGASALFGSLIKIYLAHMKLIEFQGNHFSMGFLGFFAGLVLASGEEYFQSRKKLKEYTENLENIIIEKTEEIEKKNRILIEEEKKVIELEKENTIKLERENIFADIHDNLGGKLLDLSFQLKALQPNSVLSESSSLQLQNRIQDVMKGLRSRLLAFEDIKKIEEHFESGLHFFLIRRYYPSGRNIEYVFSSEDNDFIMNKNYNSHFLNILQELVNNDLKYGRGTAVWKIGFEDGSLRIQLRSATVSETNESRGNGHHTIRRRSELIGAEFSDRIEDGFYSAELKLRIGASENPDRST